MSRVLIYYRKEFNYYNAENVDPEEFRSLRGLRPVPPAIPIPGVDRHMHALRPRQNENIIVHHTIHPGVHDHDQAD